MYVGGIISTMILHYRGNLSDTRMWPVVADTRAHTYAYSIYVHIIYDIVEALSPAERHVYSFTEDKCCHTSIRIEPFAKRMVVTASDMSSANCDCSPGFAKSR